MLRLILRTELQLPIRFYSGIFAIQMAMSLKKEMRMLTLTDNVVKRFKDILAESRIPDHGIRIFAAAGG